MKKIILLALVFTGAMFTVQSQNVSDNAIGLRLGDSNGFGAEISYQLALNTDRRLEFDFGWRSGDDYDAMKFTGLYQWVKNLDGNFNWYFGAGGGLAFYDVSKSGNETAFFIAGDIGLEYDFDFPLLLSLDFRPELGFGDFNDDVDFDIALGVRYQF